MPYTDRVKLYAAQKKHRIKIRENLLAFLETKSCVDCGEKDPIVLDFDQSDPSLKFKPVSKMLSGHYSWASVESEIKKCQVRCANCHRRKTYTDQNGWGKTRKKLSL